MFRFVASCVFVAVLSSGCSPSSDAPTETVDLVDRFGTARAEVATREVDFGDPVSRIALRAGWSWQERDSNDDTPFVWGVGEGSTVAFEVVDPRELELVLRCRGIRRTDLPPQRLTVRVNGSEIGDFEVLPQIEEFRVRLPADLLRFGENELAFDYLYHRKVGARSRRALAIAWYGIEFREQGGGGAPRLDVRGESIIVPFDGVVHFPVLLRAGTYLELDGWEVRGGGDGEFEVQLSTDAGGTRSLATLSGEGTSPQRWALEIEGPARLTVLARPKAGGGGAGGFALRGLVLERPAEPEPAVVAAADDPPSEGASRERPPNVVVYLVDTLRADRLGAYGRTPSISPRLDAFAEEGVVFEQAMAQSSWTRSAVASLFTGLWPGAHGAIGRRDRLPDGAETLAELLAEAGYETAAVFTNPNVSGNFGFRQGFQSLEHLRKQPDSIEVNEAVERWLDGYDGERPFFLYVHTADPHTPYLPPEPYRTELAADAEPVRREIEREQKRQSWDPEPETIRQLYALYDAEIAFNDESFGAFLELLKGRGLYEETFIAFVSDHGEEFYEHSAWTHGKNLYRDTLEVPFVVRFPDGPAGARVSRRVQQVDLVPTVLELAGLDTPPGLDGRSLQESLASGSEWGEWGETSYAHLHLDGPLYLSAAESVFKLVQRIDGGQVRTTLFDLSVDPLETENVADEYPIMTDYLVARLKERMRQGSPFEVEEALVDEELAKELRALGYVP